MAYGDAIISLRQVSIIACYSKCEIGESEDNASLHPVAGVEMVVFNCQAADYFVLRKGVYLGTYHVGESVILEKKLDFFAVQCVLPLKYRFDRMC